jgi:histidinol-phosphate aminotransferase
MDTPDITQAFRDAAKGLDFYWPGTSVSEACERYGLVPEQVIKMASNENAYGPSPKAIAAACKALEKAAIYPSAQYDYAGLKRALADYAGVSPDMIAPGPGSETVARYIAHLFVGPGDEVIAAPQSYDGHPWSSLLMGGIVRGVPLVDYRYDLDAILAAVNERTRIIWICNPVNPTGTVLSKSQARRLLESVPPTTAVVFDQAYREFVDDPEYGDGLDLLLEGYRNVVVLRTLSKVFGLAAVRVGYGIAIPEICTILESTSEPFHISGTACAAGVAAVTDDRAWAEEVRDLIVGERGRIERSLLSMGLGVVPSQGNYVLVDTGADALDLYERLMSHGIIVRLGSIWHYDTHVRITVGTREQNDRMLAAMAREVGASPD